jgi:SAM-dependent methyltransferase
MSGPRMTDSWKREDAASYDRHAPAYARHMERLAGPLVDTICRLAELRPGQRVLDIACGSGLAARGAARAVTGAGRVVGGDLSAGMVAVAQQHARVARLDHLSFAVMDVENLPLPAASFDAVICLSAALHFPDISRAIKEMHRVTRPGGRLVVSFGSVRPIRPLALVGHLTRRGLERLLEPVRPTLRAPDPLIRIASGAVPMTRETLHTAWSARNPKRRLVTEMRRAGLKGVTSSWVGHDLTYLTASDFLDAQFAVSTDVRKRMILATAEQRARIETEADAQARRVLNRGGTLRYAYGACFVSARRSA